MAEPILIIDPGHGGKDNGGGTNDYFLEKEMNLKISLYQLERFKELDVPIDITRNENIYLSPTVRTNIVKDSGAKYCISNHINAANPEARGVETIHSIYTEGELARKLYEEIISEGMPGRRVFSKESNVNSGKDYYYMHRETGEVITVIVEYGFATNPKDRQLLIEHWQKYAEGVVRGFCEFIGHPYEPPKDSVNKSENTNLPEIISTVNVKVDDQELQGYMTDENHSIIEIRKIANALNLVAKWDQATQTVIVRKR